jgi:hypothetical protein
LCQRSRESLLPRKLSRLDLAAAALLCGFELTLRLAEIVAERHVFPRVVAGPLELLHREPDIAPAQQRQL